MDVKTELEFKLSPAMLLELDRQRQAARLEEIKLLGMDTINDFTEIRYEANT